MYESIIYSSDGPVATIRLNRPDKLNAFGGAMREEILDAIGVVAADNVQQLVLGHLRGRTGAVPWEMRALIGPKAINEHEIEHGH